MKKVAVFASDLDNTLTDSRHLIPDQVAFAITTLYEKGFEIIFLTGRTFSFAYRSLEKFSFPYTLAVQHGAEILKMPEKKVLTRNFLSKDVVLALDEIYKEYEGDFLIYSGFETGDFCYYRKKNYSSSTLTYLQELELKATAPWQDVGDFSQITQDSFPLIKGFHSDSQVLKEIQKKLHKVAKVTSSIIKDSVDPSLYLLLITHPDACKGKALDKICKNNHLPIIAAGDDNNDIELLKRGTIKIAVGNVSEELKQIADIVAKPSKELGILPALEEAIRLLNL